MYYLSLAGIVSLHFSFLRSFRSSSKETHKMKPNSVSPAKPVTVSLQELIDGKRGIEEIYARSTHC